MTERIHQLILASAGTGKTHRLTGRFLALLFQGFEPERILATTFTRKAAGEILDRVLLRLVDAAESEAECQKLAEHIGMPDIDVERCRQLLSKLTRSLDTFQVRTIDAFFAHLVRLFALDLSLPPGWSISTETQDATLRSEALQDMLASAPRDEMLTLLRDLQAGGPSRRVHDRLLERAREDRPVYLESDDEAWQRVEAGTAPSESDVLAARAALPDAPVPQTKQGKPNKNWLNALVNLGEAVDRGDWEAVISAKLVGACLEPGGAFSKVPVPEAVVDLLAPIIQRAAWDVLQNVNRRNRATLRLLERFESAYADQKRARGLYRFDDLPLALSPRAADEAPIDARELDMWFRLDGRIDHLLLDEFQDTSPIQWRVLQKIASEIAADGTGERSFFCVGDVKQSIYGFRRAEPRLLASLPALLPGLEPEEIHRSYRSSQVVLDTVNEVFTMVAANPALSHEDVASYLPAARRWDEGYRQHEAALKLPGAARVVEARVRRDGEPEMAPMLERTIECAVAIAEEAPAATIGILMRERRFIPELIHRLRVAGLDASGEGGNELTDAEAVLAFLSLLHLIDHPSDRAARFHVVTSGIGRSLDLDDYFDDAKVRRAARRLRLRILVEGLGAVCSAFQREIEADDRWSAWDRARFEQLCEMAFGFESRLGLRVSSFVAHVRRERVESPGGARVRVMTIHGAKGLEFDAVILPELHKPFVGRGRSLLEERPLPDGPIETVSVAPRKAMLCASEMLRGLYDDATARMFEDGLCALYVAMTRAKFRLELIVPPVDPAKKITTPKTSDFLRAALQLVDREASDDSGVIWFQAGSAPGADWMEAADGSEGPVEATGAAIDSLGLATSDRPRTLPRRSPSAEEGGQRVGVSSLLGSRGGARRGTLVHHWLEGLVWAEEFALDEASMSNTASVIEPDVALQREAFSLLSRALGTDEVRDALSRERSGAPPDTQLEVRSEHAFLTVLPDDSTGEALWKGYIDRLVLARRGEDVVWADIVDYKTDRVDESDLEASAAYYRPQLEKYRDVVRAQFGLGEDAVRMRLVFLEPGRVVDLSAPARAR